MSFHLLSFVAGLGVGAVVGMFVLALCVVAGRADDNAARMFGTVVPDDKRHNTAPPRLPR